MQQQKKCIERLAKDVKYIIKNPLELENNNIYYKHDQDNILKGYALIIGNKDTPYQYGNYLFEFNYPNNYPFSPPIVKFLSNDGTMRFNPNLYINGKVCLSVLNTWHGEGWTSCMTISSVLLILSTILNNNPLENEPGIDNRNHYNNIKKYNTLVKYKNIEFSILKQIENIINNENIILLLFKQIILDNFIKNNDAIESIIENDFKNISNIEIPMYQLKFNINAIYLLNNYKKIKLKVIKK
jgi:ubiquitin-conjugating enzyme E2 Z